MTRRTALRIAAGGLATIATIAAGEVALAGLQGAAGAAESSLVRQRGTIWAVNRGLNSVTVLDGATGAVVATIPIGKEPNSVAVAPRVAKAYATEEGDGTVAVISTMTREVVKRIRLGLRPHHVRISRDGARAYVSEYGTNKIAVVDTASDAVVAEYTTHPSAAARNHSSWISADGKTLYLVNEVANEISALDAATGAPLFSLPVGNRPSEVIVTRDGKTAYVSVRSGENKIKAIDLGRRSIVGEVTLSQEPDTLQLTPDERFLAVGMRGSPALLEVVDVTSMTLAASVPIAGPGTIGGHNWLSANGRYSFMTYEGGPTPGIAVVDHAAGHKLVATYPYPGGGKPHGIFYDDPAAIEGPAVVLGSRGAVSPKRLATLAIRCSQDAVGFCRGRVTLGGLGSGSFSLSVGAAGTVRIAVSKRALRGFGDARRLRVRATAVATDQLGNRRTSARMVTMVAPRPGR